MVRERKRDHLIIIGEQMRMTRSRAKAVAEIQPCVISSTTPRPLAPSSSTRHLAPSVSPQPPATSAETQPHVSSAIPGPVIPSTSTKYPASFASPCPPTSYVGTQPHVSSITLGPLAPFTSPWPLTPFASTRPPQPSLSAPQITSTPPTITISTLQPYTSQPPAPFASTRPLAPFTSLVPLNPSSSPLPQPSATISTPINCSQSNAATIWDPCISSASGFGSTTATSCSTTPIQSWGNGHLFQVEFNRYMHPIGNLGSKLTKQLSVMVRDGRVVPLSLIDWTAVPTEILDRIWQEVTDNILNCPPAFRPVCMEKCRNMWNDYKYTIKNKYWKPFKDDPSILELCPPCVVSEQWSDLVAYWSTELAQSEFTQNSRNRELLRPLHMTEAKQDSAKRCNAIFKEVVGQDGHGYTHGEGSSTDEDIEALIADRIETFREECYDQLRAEVRAEVLAEVQAEIRAKVLAQVRVEVFAEVRDEMIVEIDQMRDELWAEFRDSRTPTAGSRDVPPARAVDTVSGIHVLPPSANNHNQV